ncbi:MAG TPA: hypothetical protein VIY08_00865 [Candidatus Nitrosocosmicus sp.]
MLEAAENSTSLEIYPCWHKEIINKDGNTVLGIERGVLLKQYFHHKENVRRICLFC